MTVVTEWLKGWKIEFVDINMGDNRNDRPCPPMTWAVLSSVAVLKAAGKKKAPQPPSRAHHAAVVLESRFVLIHGTLNVLIDSCMRE